MDSPRVAWPRSNPQRIPSWSRWPRRCCHHLFSSRQHDHIRLSHHTTIRDPILRRRTPCRMEVVIISPDSPSPTMAMIMPKWGTDHHAHWHRSIDAACPGGCRRPGDHRRRRRAWRIINGTTTSATAAAMTNIFPQVYYIPLGGEWGVKSFLRTVPLLKFNFPNCLRS